jgi:proline racemase
MAPALFLLPMIRIKTIDAEVAGEAVRLIVSGGPTVPVRTMTEKLNWLRRKGGALRRLLMLEPRGHAAMHGAILTEPISPNAHAGVLSMHAAGFPRVSGESIIGAVTIALETKLIEGVQEEVLLDTPVGMFRTSPRATGGRVTSVTVTGVPSFVHSAGLPLRIGTRNITVALHSAGRSPGVTGTAALLAVLDAMGATDRQPSIYSRGRAWDDTSGTSGEPARGRPAHHHPRV